MPMRWQSQKPELNEAAQHAIYRALEERKTYIQPQADTAERGTFNPQQRVVLYNFTLSDSASQIEALWRGVFDELKASRRHSDPEFLLPSENIFDVAEKLVRWFKVRGFMTVPEITLDGEGNLYIEFQSNNKRLSVCLSDNIAGSYIYLGDGREYTPYPLTGSDLQNAVDSYLA